MEENKLKTMKDISWELGNFTYEKLETNEMDMQITSLAKYKEALRREAVKWLVEARDETLMGRLLPMPMSSCGEDHNGIHCCDEGIINFIKHFFNISEEELKDHPPYGFVKMEEEKK